MNYPLNYLAVAMCSFIKLSCLLESTKKKYNNHIMTYRYSSGLPQHLCSRTTLTRTNKTVACKRMSTVPATRINNFVQLVQKWIIGNGCLASIWIIYGICVCVNIWIMHETQFYQLECIIYELLPTTISPTAFFIP